MRRLLLYNSTGFLLASVLAIGVSVLFIHYFYSPSLLRMFSDISVGYLGGSDPFASCVVMDAGLEPFTGVLDDAGFRGLLARYAEAVPGLRECYAVWARYWLFDFLVTFYPVIVAGASLSLYVLLYRLRPPVLIQVLVARGRSYYTLVVVVSVLATIAVYAPLLAYTGLVLDAVVSPGYSMAVGLVLAVALLVSLGWCVVAYMLLRDVVAVAATGLVQFMWAAVDPASYSMWFNPGLRLVVDAVYGVYDAANIAHTLVYIATIYAAIHVLSKSATEVYWL